MQTTKYTEYTKRIGCKQTRTCTKSAAAVGGYGTPSFVWFVYFVVSLFRRGHGQDANRPDQSRRQQGRGGTEFAHISLGYPQLFRQGFVAY